MNVILKPNEELNIKNGFPWIYKNEVKEINGELDPNLTVKVYDNLGNFVGLGYINFKSKIIVRMLTLKEEALDRAFFEKRLRDAIIHRQNLGIYESCRLVFSEGDYLPGLIVDKYEDYLVVQFETLGMDKRRSLIIDLLQKLIQPKGIIERSISPSRLKEGLEPVVKEYGNIPENAKISENGLLFSIDLRHGQKTGHFFDQRYNRLNLRKYAKDQEILDLCANTGGFTLNALASYAKEVTAVDISEKAILALIQNVKLNNFDLNKVKPVVADVFTFLKETDKTYDIVILDPPAFVKNKDQLNSAYLGYVKANALALTKVKDNGYLMTFSCSGNLNLELFLKMLNEASTKAKVKTTIVELNIQALDHPVTVNGLENLYLKAAMLKVNK